VVQGGAEAYAAALAARLRDRGHEVQALTFGVPGPDVAASVSAWPYRTDQFANQPRARRLAFHALDVYRPATRRAMSDVIRGFRPDVVHTHLLAGLSGSALATPSMLGVGHVHTLHDYWLVCQRSSLTRRDGTMCDTRCLGCRVVTGLRSTLVERHPPGVVVAVSHAIADAHADVAWVSDRVRVILNPAEAAHRTTVPHGGSLTFGYLGRLTVEKGVRTLLDAFAVAASGDHRLVIAGDGPLRPEVDARAGARVEVRGWVDNAAREAFFATIDCLVVPSQWLEPAGLVVAEARARGIPVIGGRIGGIPEMVSPRSAPLLFSPGSVGELAARLGEFASSPELYVNGADDRPMTWDEHVVQVEAAYDDAVFEVASSTAP